MIEGTVSFSKGCFFKGLAIALLFFVVAPQCVDAAKVVEDWDREFDFSVFQTFAFSEEGMPFINEGAGVAVREMVAAELGIKGFRQVDTGEADFLVVLFPREKNGLRVDWYSMGYMPWWGLWGGGYAVGARYTDIKVGSMMVDIVDHHNDRLVWRGTVDIHLTGNIKKSINKVMGGIEKLFKGFPPK